jgi:DNA helicase-2/ATP-dependent DNA helicase PcrA
MSEFQPRAEQQHVLDYRGGRMGVSAVPGAGKTITLAALAARLVTADLRDDQEVLVVTLINSAVDNIRARIRSLVKSDGLLAEVSYRVRTLHGLAHDIVREHPGLVGLAEDFQIVDEREADEVLQGACEGWLRAHPDASDALLSGDLGDGQRERVESTQWPQAVRSLAGTFVRRAKDLGKGPEDLRSIIAQRQGQDVLPLAEMGTAIYELYQRALSTRGGVDFDDLIRLALAALQLDPALLARLRHRWPFILEDEAQDSSQLQETILGLLAGPEGNWVRVGDSNQAINTTFTTADPAFLRAFLGAQNVERVPLAASGRSQPCVIALANRLVTWAMEEHPEKRVRDALAGPPFIRPVSPDDPQPNPPADPSGVYLIGTPYSPQRELGDVVRSAERWLEEHPHDTAAILVPRNQRGIEVTKALKRRGVPFIELLQSTASTRETAGALAGVLRYLGDPLSAPLLAKVLQVWRRDDREDAVSAQRLARLVSLVHRCPAVERFLWPRRGRDWLDDVQWQDWEEASEEDGSRRTDLSTVGDRKVLEVFRALVRRWHEATVLAIDQLVLTIAQDLFLESGDLALSHKLAVMLRSQRDRNPGWRLPELATELEVIARNERRFLGFSQEGETPIAEAGKVTVSTLHKAKGLEWDRVYVMSVNNYSFPSGEPNDQYISEKWFIRDQLNLEAEALAQLQALAEGIPYEEGAATRRARLDYVAERLRLLYVAITRARKELVLTWNTGRSKGQMQMAVPFIALHAWWQSYRRVHDAE